jgi:hypothetical protein
MAQLGESNLAHTPAALYHPGFALQNVQVGGLLTPKYSMNTTLTTI